MEQENNNREEKKQVEQLSINSTTTNDEVVSSSVSLSSPSLSSFITSGCKELLDLLLDEKRWKLISQDKQVNIYEARNVHPHEHAMFKGVGLVNCTPESCLSLLESSERKCDYDEIFEKFEMVEKINQHTQVEHHVYWSPPLIAKRDLCILAHKCKLKDGGHILIMAKSIVHEKCPQYPKLLRAEVEKGGWFIERIQGEPNKCKVHFLASTNLKGSLPKPLRNILGQRQPLLVNSIRALLENKEYSPSTLSSHSSSYSECVEFDYIMNKK